MDQIGPRNIDVLYKAISKGSCSVDFCRKWLREAVGVNHGDLGDLLITTVMFARRGENQQIVQMLIDEFGADPSCRSAEDGWNALMHTVCYSGSFSTEETVRILIDAGADVNYQDDEGFTVLFIVSGSSLEYSTERTVRMLIEAGVDVNLCDVDGFTALMNTVVMCGRYSSKETVRTLIDAGSNVSLRSDPYNGSALKRSVKVCKTICATVIIGMLIEAI